MKVSELTKSKLASFKSGTIMVRYLATGILWWGKIDKVEREGDYVKVITSDDMLQKDKGAPWLVLQGKRDFSFNDASGEITLHSDGANRSLMVKSPTKTIFIHSASHPDAGKTS